MAEGQTELERVVDDYLAAVRARGLSPKTVAVYAQVLTSILLPFCREQGVDAPAELSRRHLDRLSAQLLEEGGPKGKPLSRYSVASYLRTCNHFLLWAQAEGEVGPGVKAQLPRTPQRVLDVLSRAELQRLEDAAPVERDKLIVRLMADSGMRLSEVTGLRLEDLREEGRNRFLRVRGKGRGGQGLERLIPVVPALYQRLRRYIDRVRPADVSTEYVFVTRRRKAAGLDYERLEPRAVQDMIRFAAQRAGIDKRVYPHLLRHSFATWALRRNMNPLQLQRILGHADLTMITRTYSHLQADDAADALMAVLRAERDDL